MVFFPIVVAFYSDTSVYSNPFRRNTSLSWAGKISTVVTSHQIAPARPGDHYLLPSEWLLSLGVSDCSYQVKSDRFAKPPTSCLPDRVSIHSSLALPVITNQVCPPSIPLHFSTSRHWAITPAWTTSVELLSLPWPSRTADSSPPICCR